MEMEDRFVVARGQYGGRRAVGMTTKEELRGRHLW